MLARVSLHPTPFSQQGRKKLHWQVTNIRKRGFAASDPGCVRCARSGSQVGLRMFFFFFGSQKTHICSHTILSRKTNHEKPRGWGRTEFDTQEKRICDRPGLGALINDGELFGGHAGEGVQPFFIVCVGTGGQERGGKELSGVSSQNIFADPRGRLKRKNTRRDATHTQLLLQICVKTPGKVEK